MAAAIDRLAQDVLLGNEAGQLQVRIGDVSGRIRVGDQPSLDVRWKVGPPEERGNVGVGCGREPHSVHAETGSVVRPDCNRVVWDQFCQFRRLGGQCDSKIIEVLELVAHGASDANVVVVGVAKSLLQQGEEASTVGNAQGHASELAKGLVPGLGCHSGFAPEGIEDLLQPLDPMGGQLQGLGERIKDTAQNDFAGAEVGAPLQ